MGIEKKGPYLNKVLFPVLLMLFCSCESKIETNVKRTALYYDLEGLLDRQVILLDSVKAKLSKKTVIDGEMDFRTMTLDSASWAKELEIFYKVDLNDPALRAAYSEQNQQVSDSLHVLRYDLKEGRSAEIHHLSVFYNQDRANPDSIIALFKETNALYNSQRKLKLYFSAGNGVHLLSKYNISGNQKMMMKDTISYSIEGINKW